MTVLVLLSGGMDSTACIHYYQKQGNEVIGIFVDYGQPALKRELESVRAVSAFYKIELKLFSITSKDNCIRPGFIQGRNAMLLMTALLSNPPLPSLISLGIHSGTDYSDSNQAFIDTVQSVYDIYTSGQICIDVPFINWSKAELYEYCILEKIPVSLTYSCEAANKPCGNCLSCIDRNILVGGIHI